MGRPARVSGFDRVSVVRLEFQLTHRTVASRYVVTNLTEILRLDELSIGSGVAVKIPNLNYLPVEGERVTFRYSDSTHETLAVFLHQIESDGAVSIGGLGCGLGADDERSGGDKLAFEVLSRPSSRIRRVPVLANEPFGASVVHRFHEGTFCLRRHGRFTNAEYRAIFEYFDSFLVGLTATPTDEVDHNTYSLFELEDGVPTDAYGLEEAVRDKFLVPPRAVSVPLRFQREGMNYDQLSDEEKERWDAIEWDEDGAIPRTVEPEALNRWLFNEDTVDKVLEQLMRSGEKVADGDRLGKTIIFAKNHAHAQFIADRFDKNYPHQRGVFARVIDFQVEYAQSLIDDFSSPSRAPHIAISVDMLDTGIDIPEIVNLVFFKMVRSRTKFWQMVGRGTRLRPDLFGPGRHKREFWIFDYCQNLEFFSQNLGTTSGATNESLSKKLFAGRVELIAELDKHDAGVATGSLRGEVAERLRQEVAQMNVNNFIVRPKRRLVEKYADAAAWEALGLDERNELVGDVAGLPSELVDEDLEAKQFDLLMLRLQLGLLRHERSFTRWSEDVRQIAGALEEKASIPMVRAELELIIEVQTDEFWQDITASMLEDVRKRLRSLVKFIEKTKRQNIYTDFADLIGEEREIDLPGFALGHDVERFREKTQQFLKAHENDPVIHKLRWNEPLSKSDLDALEKILADAGMGTPDDLSKVRSGGGLGLFVREMIGLDREAAKRAFDGFLAGKTLTANQIQFVNLVIDNLTQSGWMSAAQLYESPFTDFSPKGVEGVFASEEVLQMVGVLDDIRNRAAV